MNEKTWSSVDAWLEAALGLDDPILDACLDANSRAGLPAIDVSPLQGKLLFLLAQAMGARRILEIGALGGYSTIWLARALPADGRLVTLELNPTHASVARSNIARAGLADKVEVIEGPALETLLRLDAEHRGPFDLIFIDADKPGYPAYLRWALRLARPGALILGDNVVRRGLVIDPGSADPNVLGVREFIESVAADPRLSATVIQTAGKKGYDGLLIARVAAD